MLLVTVKDQEDFWKNEGILYITSKLNSEMKKEIQLFCAFYCPDRILRLQLLKENREMNEKNCKEGNHTFDLFSIDTCRFCGVKNDST